MIIEPPNQLLEGSLRDRRKTEDGGPDVWLPAQPSAVNQQGAFLVQFWCN
jgi:hypothetical protein